LKLLALALHNVTGFESPMFILGYCTKKAERAIRKLFRFDWPPTSRPFANHRNENG